MDLRSITYFDSVARQYFASYAEASAAGHTLRMRKARTLEMLAGTEGSVLDVGCGPGVMVEDVLRLGCSFWGVDGSPQMIEQCESAYGQLSRAKFRHGNALALPFADGMFDAVLCMGVIDRVTQPEAVIGEMGRVLRPGGILLISFPNLLSPYAFWRSHVYYRMVGHLKRLIARTTRRRRRYRLAAPAALWAPSASCRMLQRLIGDVTEIAYYNFGLLPSPLEEFFPSAALRLAERLESLRESKLRWLGAGFVLKAVKADREEGRLHGS